MTTTTPPGPPEGWHVPYGYVDITEEEVLALGAYTAHIVETPGGHAIEVRGDGTAEPALAALRLLRTPPPPPPPSAAEEVARRHPHLTPGRRYRIKLDDCCIQGQLHGVYHGPVEYPAEEGGGLCGYRFDIGTLEPEWAAISFTEEPQ